MDTSFSAKDFTLKPTARSKGATCSTSSDKSLSCDKNHGSLNYGGEGVHAWCAGSANQLQFY